jgi:hypothetical protein
MTDAHPCPDGAEPPDVVYASEDDLERVQRGEDRAPAARRR